ncbi:MAG: hypothetical protein ABJL72_16840 [Roseobacter sp.]
MNFLRTVYRRIWGAAVAIFMLCSAAIAACTDLSSPEFSDLGVLSIEDLQLSLREAYQDETRELADGRLGPETRSLLARLCSDVPRPDGNNEILSTLQLVSEYLEVQLSYPDWFDRLSSLDLTAQGDQQSQQALGLRLASIPAMKTMAMGRRALTYDCADPGAALTLHPDGARALGVLTRLFRDKSEVEICRMMPVTNSVEEWQQAMTHLGVINNRRAGGLSTLHNTGFLDWVAAGDRQKPGETATRLRRLTGTLPAVLTLIDDFNAQNIATPGATNYRGGPCSPRPPERTLTFYSIEASDVEALDFLVTLTPKLNAFRAEKGGFGSPQALWRELRPVLAQDLDDCILREIEPLVLGPEELPLSFLLKPTATETLMARKELETAIPVLTELTPARTATKAELVNRIKAGLLDVQNELVGEQVATAADTLAAASEPVPPATDTALIELDTEGDPDPTPLITVTDATDQAVQTAIDNPELVDALRNTPMADASGAELIRSQVRAALENTADDQAQRAVETQIAMIEPAVTSEWTLTEALQNEILAMPFVRAMVADATADGFAERLKPLQGVSYPSFRLFEEALLTVSQEKEMVRFSQFVKERIVEKAQKNIVDPQIIRNFGPFQMTSEEEDCNCVPERQSKGLQVYGFYPFWLAPKPVLPSKLGASDEAASEDGGDPIVAEKPQLQTQVDFGTISQLAFYGLEFSAEDGNRVSLRNEQQWRAAKRNFVNSAHQFRARADLAFDLREWKSWDEATIDDVVEDIAIEMAPFDRFEGAELRHVTQAIPTIFDPVQPDGVTLIFHDYNGNGLTQQQMKTMVRIIKSVYEALPDRRKQKINVGFDFPLEDEDLKKPIFDELFELLLPNPYVLADEDAANLPYQLDDTDRETTKVIDKILLFLERPTTDAKKGLRARMEQGLFQGEVRRQVLRSIIPIVPPGGHELVRTSVKENAPDKSKPPRFSQFEDDVVYFKDNFSGIGFWPVLDPLAADTPRMNTIIADHFNAPRLPPILAGFSRPVERVCTFACPNRAKIGLAAIGLFLTVVLLTWRSFYSGIVDKIAFRFMSIGLVWIGNVVLVGALFVLANCDPFSVWPDRLMALLIVVLGVLLFYNFVQRIKNGPMP